MCTWLSAFPRSPSPSPPPRVDPQLDLLAAAEQVGLTGSVATVQETCAACTDPQMLGGANG